MGYYGGSNGMDGNMAQGMNRMNQNMGGMNARPGSMAGRNIHINPKFQNLAGMPNISAAIAPTGGFSPNPNAGAGAGAKSATWDNNRSSMSPVRSTRPGTENNGDYQRDRQSVSLTFTPRQIFRTIKRVFLSCLFTIGCLLLRLN